MKNIIIRNPLFSAIIVILLIVIGGLLLGTKKDVNNSGVDSKSTTTANTITTTSNTVTNSGTKSPSVSAPTKSYGTSLPITVSKSVNEDEYIRQLLANQRTCEQLAEKQFDSLYSGTLTSANFTDRYTTSGGQCYMTVFGQTREKYATSSVGHIYVRDVLRNIVLGECTSPTGGVVTNPQWSCTIKSTGQKLDKVRFDDYVNSLL
jgi:hypothetical protein